MNCHTWPGNRKSRVITLTGLGLGLLLLVSACQKIPILQGKSEIGLEPGVTAGEDFAIYLFSGKIPPSQVLEGVSLLLESQPLISQAEILKYTFQTHTIHLTREGVDKLTNLQVPVNGIAFAACVDGKQIYRGSFWAAYSSLSYNGVIIDPLLVSQDNPYLEIHLGYPGESFFTGQDPRGDQRIMNKLEEAGKLRWDDLR